MTVEIDGNALTHIIDTNFGEEKNVSAPDWINQDPEIDTNVWSGTPLIIVYAARVTDAIKWALDQLLIAHQKIYMEDDTYNIIAEVWVRSINETWEGDVDYSNPWLLEIELVVINMLEGDYTTWALMWNVSSVYGGFFGIQSIDESSDLIIIFDGYTGGYTHIHTLSTGALLSATEHIIYGWDQIKSTSVLGKYFATVINDSGPKLKIYKNCVLIQTIDLDAVCGWNRTTDTYMVSINSSGKYILVYQFSDEEYALFVGS